MERLSRNLTSARFCGDPDSLVTGKHGWLAALMKPASSPEHVFEGCDLFSGSKKFGCKVLLAPNIAETFNCEDIRKSD